MNHLEGKEFLSVWKMSHLWAGYDPESTDPNALPEDVRDNIHLLIVAHLRGDLPLRGKRFYYDNRDESFLNILLTLPLFVRLRRYLTASEFDKDFLSSLRVARGELLRWCEKEYRAPPPFWLPENTRELRPAIPQQEDDADEEGDDWYDKLTDLRKVRVACLENARLLWADKPKSSYKEIYSHPIVNRLAVKAGFNTLENFKRWARRVAPDEAKEPGRTKETKD